MLLKPIWIPKDNKSWKDPKSDPKSDHFPGSFSNVVYCCSLWDQCTPGVRSKTFREPTIIRVSAWIKKKYPLYFQAVFLEYFLLARSPEEINYREGLIREGNSWLRYSVSLLRVQLQHLLHNTLMDAHIHFVCLMSYL